MSEVDIGRLIIEIVTIVGIAFTGLRWLGAKIERVYKTITEYRPAVEARFKQIETAMESGLKETIGHLETIDGRLGTMNGSVAEALHRIATNEGAIETLQERPR